MRFAIICILYRSSTVTILRQIRLVGHEAYIGRMKYAIKIVVGNPEKNELIGRSRR
jgi:hypothetical protein